jgi:hypothetical protein
MVLSSVISSGCPFPTSPSSQSHFCNLRLVSVSPFPATLTSSSQLHENTTTLSPAFATLKDLATHNSFACHSYRKHPGWGSVEKASACFLCPQLLTSDPQFPRFVVRPGITPPFLAPPPSPHFLVALEPTPAECPQLLILNYLRDR